MKRFLAVLSVLTIAASCASCGKSKSSGSDSSSKAASSSASESEAEKTTLSSKDAQKALDMVAGEYPDTCGLSKVSDDIPEGYEALDVLKEKFKDDPISISADGVLRFDGKDYQLVPELVEDEHAVLSVEGSGFDIKKFTKKYKVSSKDYSGVACVEYEVQHGTLNGEDWPLTYLQVYITNAGSEDYCVGVTASPKDEDNDDDKFAIDD